MIASFRETLGRSGVLRNSAVVGIGLAAVKAAGAVKVVFLARAFGAGDELDAYLVGLLLPSFVSEILVGSLSAALIPALIRLREREGREAAERIGASLLAAVVLGLTAVAALLWALSPMVLRLLGADFNPGKRRLALSLFQVLLLILPLSGFSTVWRAVLNSEEHFTAAALAPVATPALTIALLWMGGSRVSIQMLAAAHLVGLALELAWLATAIWRARLGLRLKWTGWESGMRSILLQHLPLMAVAVTANGGILVDQWMAATLASGSLSALNYGVKLAAVSGGVIGGALSTAALPRLAKYAAALDGTGLRNTIRQYAKFVLLAVVPGTLLMIALSDVLVRLVFQRGALTATAADLVISVQRWSLLQLPFVVFSSILLRTIAALQANHLLIGVGMAGLILNVVLDLALKRSMGLSGIALASSLVQLGTAGYVLILVKNRIPSSK